MNVDQTATQQTQLASARHAARVVGLILPLTLTFVATLVTAMWVPRMPDPMAVHWGADFRPDGFGPPWSNVALSLGTGLLLTAMYFLQHLQRARPGAAQWGPMHRFLPAMILGTVTLLQVISVATAWLQLDAVHATETPATGWVIMIAFVLWVSVSVVAYLVQPKLRIDAPETAFTQPMPLKADERAIWFGEARAAKPFVYVMGPSIAVLFGATVWLFSIGAEPIAAWITLGCTALLAVLFLTNTWFRVRVDRSGLTARSAVGWPVYRVPIEDVKAVRVVEINPFAEYGGWGVRHSPNGFGIVLRAGEGIVVDRHSRSRTFAVTVDDAASAGSLLAAFAPNLDAPDARSRQ
ncbi:MAG: DUF1648 domain-containing protein [Leucobacter sp.]|jgi:hypothetical protein|nr:DUF1648 domain-containing protein [Leucobacter sp.]